MDNEIVNKIATILFRKCAIYNNSVAQEIYYKVVKPLEDKIGEQQKIINKLKEKNDVN